MVRLSPTQSATLYKVGTKKRGNDENIWIVAENSNGIKRWKIYKKPQKQPSKSRKLTDVYSNYQIKKISTRKLNDILKVESPNLTQFMTDVSSIIDATKFIYPLPMSVDGYYFVNSVFDQIDKEKYVVAVVYLSQTNDSINWNQGISIFFSKLRKTDSEPIAVLLKKYFKNKYIWNGTSLVINIKN